jgi:hypothetical protein
VTSRRWALALLACAGGVLASCSSNGTPKATTTTTHHRASTTTSSSTTTASSSTTTSTTAGSSACNHITAAAGPSSGAAGTITGVVNVTNTGGSACTVTGVDGLTVSVTPQSSAQPIAFALAPSASAQFAYQYSDVPVGNETNCPSSEQASVTMPSATTASPTFAFSATPCNHGTVRVSAVYATS